MGAFNAAFSCRSREKHDADKLIAYIQKEIVLCSACGNKNCGGHMIKIARVPLLAAGCHHEIGKCGIKQRTCRIILYSYVETDD